MPTPFPPDVYNVFVVQLDPVNGFPNIIGKMPVQSGMPIYNESYPPPGPIVQQIDYSNGVVYVAPSGITALQGNYPYELRVNLADAVNYGWPSGANCENYGPKTYVITPQNARGTYLPPGEIPSSYS